MLRKVFNFCRQRFSSQEQGPRRDLWYEVRTAMCRLQTWVLGKGLKFSEIVRTGVRGRLGLWLVFVLMVGLGGLG